MNSRTTSLPTASHSFPKLRMMALVSLSITLCGTEAWSQLDTSSGTFLAQDQSGIAGTGEPNNRFGEALAHGDFNGDGFDDLAVGAPGTPVTLSGDIGGFTVIYGSENGFASPRTSVAYTDLPDINSAFQNFGATLAAGNFNGDAYDDLAVADPDWGSQFSIPFPTKTYWGVVRLYYGSAAGLVEDPNLLWQDRSSVQDQAEQNDHFGTTLLAADFNNDGRDDLVVGVPLEDVGTLTDAGGVAYFRGAPLGLSLTANVFFTQNTTGVVESSEAYDYFGEALAAGDFDKDGYIDLAIGVPGEDRCGGVTVLKGSTNGLLGAGSYEFRPSDFAPAQICGPTFAESFGSRLASGDFSNDGYADLAIAELSGSLDTADIFSYAEGRVFIVRGSNAGLAPSSFIPGFPFNFSQASLSGAPGLLERFGGALTVGDFDGNGVDDLAIGVPMDDIGAGGASGAYHVLYSRQNSLFGYGLSSIGDQYVFQNDVGGIDEVGDLFGSALTAGDFNGDGADDLAVSAPFEDYLSEDNVGAVIVSLGAQQPANLLWGIDTHLSQSTAAPGQTVVVNWHLQNDGIAGTGTFEFEIFLASTLCGVKVDGVPITSTLLDTVTVGNLGSTAGGAEGTVIVTIPSNYGAGQRELCLIADSTDAVSEQNENDNQITFSFTVEQGEAGLFSDGFESGDTSAWS